MEKVYAVIYTNNKAERVIIYGIFASRETAEEFSKKYSGGTFKVVEWSVHKSVEEANICKPLLINGPKLNVDLNNSEMCFE